MAQVRYIVQNVDEAIAFYTQHLGFSLQQQYGPAMAILELEDLKLWLAGPSASASQPMPDGSQPEPGGWARIVVTVANLEDKFSAMSAAGVPFRNSIISGPGGSQVLAVDPSGNLIELFEPTG